MTNKLEEYRDKNAYGEIDYKQGFDAAIALDLPVKFALWAMDDYILNDENKEHPVFDNIFRTERREPKELYKYWINNIYKPE